MFKLFTFVDVSKDSFSATGLDSQGNVGFSLPGPMDKMGFKERMKAISSNGKSLSSVTAGRESPGCYPIHLFSFLTNRRREYGGHYLVDFQHR